MGKIKNVVAAAKNVVYFNIIKNNKIIKINLFKSKILFNYIKIK